MISQTLAQIIKSPWTYAGLFVALVALAGGFLYQTARPFGAAAVEPTPWPDNVPQELPRDFHPSEVRFTSPTDASREAAHNCPTGNIGNVPGSSVWHCLERGGVRPLSESEIQALRLEQEGARQRAAGASDAPMMGGVIELKNGKTIQLPDDVFIVNELRFGSYPLQSRPAHTLSNGVSRVEIDAYGKLLPGTSQSALDEFEFLRGFQDDFPVIIQLAGRDVELPDRVFVRLKALNEAGFGGASPPKGLAYPVYVLGKGGLPLLDSITVDANGKLIPGVPEDLLGEFEFLKEFQDE